MNRYRKPVFWVVTVFAVALLVYFGLKPKPVAVDVAKIERGTLIVTVDDDGEAVIRDRYILSAPLPGKLKRVELEPGDSVKKDDVVALVASVASDLLDPRSESEALARVHIAEANLQRLIQEKERQVVEVEKWMRYAERDEGRVAGGQISRPVLKDTKDALRLAQINRDASQAAVKAAEYELDLAKAALKHNQEGNPDQSFSLKSPVNGVVLRRFLESETVVSPGEQILEIGDRDNLEIRMDVLSQDAVKIRPGQRVIVEGWGGEKELQAVVRLVEPSAFTKTSALGIEEQRVYIFADISGEENAGKELGDGYRIEGRVVVQEKQDAVKIPVGALFRYGEEWNVYVVKNDVAVLKTVDVGITNGIESEVISGLNMGDVVVLHPGDRVKDGSEIEKRDL